MDDLIRRQAAIDATKRVLGDHEITRTMQTALHILPTIEPEQIVRCKDCKFYRRDGCFFSTAETIEDGFCNWAERKDGSCHEPST